MLALLFACAAPAPTAPAAEDTGHGEDTAMDEPLAGEVVNHVVLGYRVAERDEGFDVDGDGEADNAVWALDGLLDPMIAEGLVVAMHVVIAQVSGVEDWVTDDTIRVGVLTAHDADADGTNNAGASFSGGPQVDEDLLANVATDTALAGGAYTAAIAVEALPVGSYELDLATPLHVTATVDAAGESGLLGFGISLDALAVALAAEGFSDDMRDTLAALADLDLDGDGEPEALSAAFRFDAAACEVVP